MGMLHLRWLQQDGAAATAPELAPEAMPVLFLPRHRARRADARGATDGLRTGRRPDRGTPAQLALRRADRRPKAKSPWLSVAPAGEVAGTLGWREATKHPRLPDALAEVFPSARGDRDPAGRGPERVAGQLVVMPGAVHGVEEGDRDHVIGGFVQERTGPAESVLPGKARQAPPHPLG